MEKLGKNLDSFSVDLKLPKFFTTPQIVWKNEQNTVLSKMQRTSLTVDRLPNVKH